ncbi:MAG: helix-turn-helix domain-containing protein [Oscillospiraceae bacterium]|nr:helix-turn-helix domain-containing protein [Oscillospiraceae bacterium]
MNTYTVGKNICQMRKQKGLTQEELAARLNISYQAVSKWENGVSLPDISMLPGIAVNLGCSIDSLLGYAAEKRIMSDYESRYSSEGYYWGVKPSEMCYEVMRLMPPVRPLRLLDIGCGEGKDAVFFARNGYKVSAFDITEKGIDKAKRLAEAHGVPVNFFRADVCDFRLESDFDVIFSSGVFHFIPEDLRSEIFENYRSRTAPGGINAMNVFVKKPFIPVPPDKDSRNFDWRSGELFGYYTDWQLHKCDEVIFDCNSGGVPHKHCMDIMIARNLEEQAGVVNE